MTPELATICAEIGVTVVHPSKHRPHVPMHTAAGETLERLLADHGADHLRSVLLSIVETENNRHMLVAPIIKAVSDTLLAHPSWFGGAFLEAMDKIDLADMYDRAKANREAVKGLREAIATMLYETLRGQFHDEPEPRLI